MFKAIKNGFMKFFGDEVYFVSWWDKWVAKVRGMIQAAALAGVAYADQLAAALGPQWATRIKVGSIAAGAFSLMLRAGDKTPENVKTLAATIPTPPAQP